MNNYKFSSVFFKKPKHVWKKAQSVQQSVVLASIPDGELLNINAIVQNVLSNKDNTALKYKKDIEMYLSECVKNGFVAEVHGEELWRLFKDKLNS